MFTFGNLSAQGIYTQFGKNRIQYKQHDWAKYETDFIEANFYIGGRDLARYSVLYGQHYLDQLQQMLDYRLNDKITFVIYTSQHDLLQTNLLSQEDGFEASASGYTPLHGNKVFLYFNGDYLKFDEDVKAGIVTVFLNEMMFGGSVTERVQNELLLNMPDWYLNGLVLFLADGIKPSHYQWLSEGVESGRFSSFNKLSAGEADMAAAFVWQYIYNSYGRRAIANILYQVRMNKSMEHGFRIVLGKPYRMIYQEWLLKTKPQLSNGETPQQIQQIPLRKRVENGNLIDFKVQQGGQKALWLLNTDGKQQVWLQDISSGSFKRIYNKGRVQGINQFEENYPIGAFSTDKNRLAIVVRQKNYPVIMEYNMEERKWDKKNKVILERLDNLLSIEYIDRRNLLISGVRRGQTDVFQINMTSSVLRPLTNNIFSGLEVGVSEKGRFTMFSGNAPEGQENAAITELIDPSFEGFTQKSAGFYLDMSIPGNHVRRLSFNDNHNFIKPKHLGGNYFGLLSDSTGTYDLFASYPDSIFQHIRVIVDYHDEETQTDTFLFYQNDTAAINFPNTLIIDSLWKGIDTAFVYKDTAYLYRLTQMPSDINFYDVDSTSGRIFGVSSKDGRNIFFSINLPADIPSAEIKRGNYSNFLNLQKALLKSETLFKTEQQIVDSNVILNDTLFFLSEFLFRPQEVAVLREKTQSQGQIEKANLGAARPYFLHFTPDHIIAQVSNNNFISPYLPFNSQNASGGVKGFDGMLKLGLSDDLMDHRIIGGVGMSTQFGGIDVMFNYQNLKKRLNKEFLFYRSNFRVQNEFENARYSWNEMRFRFSYPFTRNTRIELQPFGRHEQFMLMATSRQMLETPVVNEFLSGAKLSYIADYTLPTGTNLLSGTRYIIYGESFTNFNQTSSTFITAGADFRHYIPLVRNITWANRFAVETSLGNSHVAYVLGGVENWLAPEFNDNILFSPSVNYQYKFIAGQMRGFNQNIRNGTSYSVFNSELRVPFFQMFSRRPLTSKFLNNFQVVGFYDVGSAWQGLSPYSEENSVTTEYIERNSLIIKVESLREPIVMGYGLGMRTTLLGFFIKLDFAWGVEDWLIQPRKTYISMGLDF